MGKQVLSVVCVAILIISLVTTPSTVQAQQKSSQEDDAVFYAGSLILSLLLFPVKLTTCIGTQAASAVAYTATYGVAGHYDGGTNGKEIGEVARGACKGSWLVGMEDVKRDYE